ncbi:serine/threonine-protein kinase [Streptomyces sp. UNOC14_S4]|uniref:serine/threonine-protein kinase n=1 Tax=Streptomyces sp. UNOC14_S4 TaxID=2872340 RepID=UPI001E58622B|nr:serine/threonine-protein kinase [Streptomyces sp. UNOC14_S4]MCC3770932.1 serine/threonine protein kinase [Streptomyces sp. UNOC14_S4]
MGGAASSEIFQALETDDPARAGDYELVARLGAGGMGKVYLSYSPAGRPVAIKVIRPELADDPEFRRRFRQEVTAARRVHGLYTAPVLDSDTEGPRPWLATAFVQGPTLADAVARHGALPVPAVLLLTAGVAEALQAIHAAGVVHRDLKPSNVLLASDGPRVIDFGIARAADATSLTDTGVAVGTPAFMAPEQAAGRDVGPATDVFALGQVAAYAAKGVPAYGIGSSHAVLYRIVHEDPDLSSVPEALLPLLTRLLAKEPGARPSLAEVVDLCRAASGTGGLRRAEDWLPGAVTSDITRRQRSVPVQPVRTMPTQPATQSAPPAPPAVPPVAPPAAVHYAPTAPAVRQDAAFPAPPPGVPTPPPPGVRTPPLGVPVHPWPARHPQPVGVRPYLGPPPGNGRRKRTVRNAAGMIVALLVAAGGCAVMVEAANQQKSGGESGQKSAESRDKSQKSKRPDPEPVSYPDFQMPDGYHLVFDDEHLEPKRDNYDDFYYFCGSADSCHIGSYSTKLVLLNGSEKGSLDTCRSVTRYTDRIDQKQLGENSQICVRTGSGHIALVTYKGASEASDPSRYMTLDIKVWRNAVGTS